jgi:hypothetical protein
VRRSVDTSPEQGMPLSIRVFFTTICGKAMTLAVRAALLMVTPKRSSFIRKPASGV